MALMCISLYCENFQSSVAGVGFQVYTATTTLQNVLILDEHASLRLNHNLIPFRRLDGQLNENIINREIE